MGDISGAVTFGLALWVAVWVPGGIYLAARRRPREGLRWFWRTAPVAGFFAVYSLVADMNAHVSPTGAPLRHAQALVGLERTLHLWWEPTLSHLALPGAQFYYDTSHLVTLAALTWVGVTQPHLWRRARNSFMVLNAIAIPVYLIWPTDPPRLLPVSYGIHGHSLGVMGAAADQFASFPSMHVGYAVWVGLIVAASSTRFRRIGWVHAVLTAIVVVTTGNHYVIDVVVGGGLAVGCWALSSRFSGSQSVGALIIEPLVDRDDPVSPLPVAARVALP